MIPPYATYETDYALKAFQSNYPDLYKSIKRAQQYQLDLELILSDDRLLIYDLELNTVVYKAVRYYNMTDEEIRRFFARRFEMILWWSGYRQTDLAEAVGCTQQQISQYVRGDTMPSILNLIKIADVFGCSLDDFRFVDLDD